jgi:hypothetical protein
MPAHGYFCADAAAVNAMASGSQVTLGQQRAAIGKARRATRCVYRGGLNPCARTRPRLPRRPEAWWSVQLCEREIANFIDEVYGEGSKFFGDILCQIVIGVEFNA